MERALASYHPIVSFLFFVVVIGMSMLYMHPVLLLISLISAIIYSKRLRSGLKTDVYVMNAVKEGVLRLANASYYVGHNDGSSFNHVVFTSAASCGLFIASDRCRDSVNVVNNDAGVCALRNAVWRK